MLLIQNKRVNWETYQIGIPGATAKDKENRRIPFNPKDGSRQSSTRRAKLGPDAYVFGAATATTSRNSDGLGDAAAAGERHGTATGEKEPRGIVNS